MRQLLYKLIAQKSNKTRCQLQELVPCLVQAARAAGKYPVFSVSIDVLNKIESYVTKERGKNV